MGMHDAQRIVAVARVEDVHLLPLVERARVVELRVVVAGQPGSW